MLNQNLLLTGDDGYNLTKSLRFRSSASAYLSRTPASASNRKTWTFSAWIKRGQLGIFYPFLQANYSSIPWFVVGFSTSNAIEITQNAGSSSSWESTAVFRDCSAWYHIVCVLDTTSATSTMNGSSTDRIRLYVNGTQYVITGGTIPSQNSDLQVNNNVAHTIGGYVSHYGDGYMAETNFIDGQALTPSSFGETDPITGVWKAKKYGGTYGTNGFYLPFTNTTSTTTLGYDFSGNSNNWTTNNLSLTAGTTYDSMTDVPTLTSATTANYCVFNPLALGTNITTTNGNLTAQNTVSESNHRMVKSTFGLTTGKWYWELNVNNSANVDIVGLTTTVSGLGALSGYAGDIGYGYNTTSGAYYANSGWTTNGTPSAFPTSGIINIAYDADAGKIWFGANGTWFNSGDPATGANAAATYSGTAYTFVPALSIYANTGSWNINFGQRAFTSTPPTGFVALNTFNLPEPSIKAGNKQMNVLTYAGDGTNGRNITGFGFSPEFLWIKKRSGAEDHKLNDIVRGVDKQLMSNRTEPEYASTDQVRAFLSDGFTTDNSGSTNGSGHTYVAWAWKANGAGSSNTAGSITSTVSANPTAGFSVVTYTGTGANATVGHGLGVAPSMIIVKRRNSTGSWDVYHQSVGNTKALFLNQTASENTDIGYWNNTSPTSSVFTVGIGTEVNQSGGTYVAYCFAEVAGYSKAFSYTGNGSTDGTFLHLGFKPKFVLIKSTGTQDWVMLDSATNPYNVAGNYLRPNSSGAENGGSTPTTSTYEDFLSNGIKFRNDASSSGYTNASGVTYIGIAFAESPFKYSLAR